MTGAGTDILQCALCVALVGSAWQVYVELGGSALGDILCFINYHSLEY